jgi:hypothetical protein
MLFQSTLQLRLTPRRSYPISSPTPSIGLNYELLTSSPHYAPTATQGSLPRRLWLLGTSAVHLGPHDRLQSHLVTMHIGGHFLAARDQLDGVTTSTGSSLSTIPSQGFQKRVLKDCSQGRSCYPLSSSQDVPLALLHRQAPLLASPLTLYQ